MNNSRVSKTEKLYLLSIKGTKNMSGKSFTMILKQNILFSLIFQVADIWSFLVLDLGRDWGGWGYKFHDVKEFGHLAEGRVKTDNHRGH